ncbi:MAG: hypothetical protein PHT50_02285 [Candidatus Omnitrophica bacterium]|nr:hypothetical protein [Candidatus Omnitrophota bacterium]
MRNKTLVLFLIILLFGSGLAFGAGFEGWASLKNDNSLLYSILRFLNPPGLNSVLFTVFTIIFAIGTVPCIIAFERWPKVFFLLLSLFCWARIASFFVMSYLSGQIITSP